MPSYRLGKKCLECGARLLDKNKTGFCNKHRNRTGQNNPFFGKKHKQETIDTARPKCVAKSKANWQKEDYRKKVIKGLSKPRRAGFGKEQSARTTQWYRDNPGQREIRSATMKHSWETGKLVVTKNFRSSKSKAEKQFIQDLINVFPRVESDQTIRSGKTYYFPDGLVKKDGVVIEYFGDYWHANPNIYNPEDIIGSHKILAKNIWAKDAQRKRALEDLGYLVIIVWASEYKSNKDLVLRGLNGLLNWEGCAF